MSNRSSLGWLMTTLLAAIGPAACGGSTSAAQPGGLAEQVPAVQVPAGQVPAEQVPAGQVPAGLVPAGQVPAGLVPAGQVPRAGPAVHCRRSSEVHARCQQSLVRRFRGVHRRLRAPGFGRRVSPARAVQRLVTPRAWTRRIAAKTPIARLVPTVFCGGRRRSHTKLYLRLLLYGGMPTVRPDRRAAAKARTGVFGASASRLSCARRMRIVRRASAGFTASWLWRPQSSNA